VKNHAIWALWATMSLTAAATVGAYERTISYSIHETIKGIAILEAQGLAKDATAVTVHEHDEIIFAELHLEQELQQGLEVELWPAVEGDVPPWELESIPFHRNFWITEERTGSFLRFDVTDVARAWESGSFPNLGLVLRIVTETQEATEQANAPSLAGAKDVTLTYYIQPLHSLPQDQDGHVDPPSGKTPRTERQGNGDPE